MVLPFIVKPIGNPLHEFAGYGPAGRLHCGPIAPVEYWAEKLPVSHEPDVPTEQLQPQLAAGKPASWS